MLDITISSLESSFVGSSTGSMEATWTRRVCSGTRVPFDASPDGTVELEVLTGVGRVSKYEYEPLRDPLGGDIGCGELT